MKIKEIVCALEKFAPLPLQESYDNAGLQVGLTDAEVAGALLCLDVTEAVVDEAIALGYNLVVAHHPILFKGLKKITGRSEVERCVMKAIKHGIVLYAAHTNMDNAEGGVNHKMAEKLGLSNLQVLEPKADVLMKLTTFVPTAHADAVRNALFQAGCGCIGNYDSCSYNVQGHGTFRAQEGTHPFCGQIGERHTEEEVRIETVLPAYQCQQAVSALMEAHPYEEPAYDLYPLKNAWQQAGSGIIGELGEEMSEESFLMKVKEAFGVACVRHTALMGRRIRRVALCGGAGSFLIGKAASSQADAFITGEIHYHEFFGWAEQLLLAEIGHYESEQYTKEIFYSIIRENFPNVPVRMTTVNTNPINYL